MFVLSNKQKLFFDENIKLKNDINYIDYHKSGLGCTGCKALTSFETSDETGKKYYMDIEIKKHKPHDHINFKEKFLQEIKIRDYKGTHSYESGLQYERLIGIVENQNVTVKAFFYDDDQKEKIPRIQQLVEHKKYMIPNKDIYMTYSLMKKYLEHVSRNNRLKKEVMPLWLLNIWKDKSSEIDRYNISSYRSNFILNNQKFILLPFHPLYIPILDLDEKSEQFYRTTFKIFYETLVKAEKIKEKLKILLEIKKVNISDEKHINELVEQFNEIRNSRKKLCNEFVDTSRFVIFLKPDQSYINDDNTIFRNNIFTNSNKNFIFSLYDLTKEKHLNMLKELRTTIYEWFEENYGSCGYSVNNLYIYTTFPHHNIPIVSFQVKYIDLTKQNPFTRMVDRTRELSLDDLISYLEKTGNMYKYFGKFYSSIDRPFFKLAKENLLETVLSDDFNIILNGDEMKSLLLLDDIVNIKLISDKLVQLKKEINEINKFDLCFNFLSFVKEISLYIYHFLFKLLYINTSLYPFITNYENVLTTDQFKLRDEPNCDNILYPRHMNINQRLTYEKNGCCHNLLTNAEEQGYAVFKKNVEIKKIFLDVTKGRALFCTFSVICEIDDKQYIVNFTNTDVNYFFKLQYVIDKKKKMSIKVVTINEDIDIIRRKIRNLDNESKSWHKQREKEIETEIATLSLEKNKLAATRVILKRKLSTFNPTIYNDKNLEKEMKKYFDFTALANINTSPNKDVEDLLIYGIMNNESRYDIDICMLPLKEDGLGTYKFDNFDEWKGISDHTKLFTDVRFPLDKIDEFNKLEGFYETYIEYEQYSNIYETIDERCKLHLDLKSPCINIFHFILYKYIDDFGEDIASNIREIIATTRGSKEYIFMGPKNLPYIAFPDKGLTDDIKESKRDGKIHYVTESDFDYIIWYVHKETWVKSLSINTYVNEGQTLEDYLKDPSFKLEELNKEKICKVTNGMVSYPHTIRNVTVDQLDELYIFINWFKNELEKREVFSKLDKNIISFPYFHYPIKLKQSTLHLHIKSKKKTKYVRQIATNYLDKIEALQSPSIDQIYYQKIIDIKPSRFSWKIFPAIKERAC